MQIIYSADHILRNAKTELNGGLLVRPFECPERMDFILQSLDKAKFDQITPPKSGSAKEIIGKIHDADYLEFLDHVWRDWQASGFEGEAIPTVWPSRSLSSAHIPNFVEGKLGYYALAGETSIDEGTRDAAYCSADVAFSAADHVASSAGSSVFALTRPPGHHASRDQFGGYCFLNNAAIAAQHMLDCGAKKMAILDIDFHHGNGTQAIFYDRDDVLFLSLHGDPSDAFPHFLGYADEKGHGSGEGFNVNYPLPRGTTYDQWLEALEDSFRHIKNFGCDGLVVSLGVDIFEKDPISFFKLRHDDFSDIGRRISGLSLPTVFIMEGGYAVAEIGVNVVNVLTGFEAG